MTRPTSKPSQEQAANFHVLPKSDPQKQQGRKPASAETATGHIIEHDADAGSLVGMGHGGEVTRQPTDDRSQLS